MAVLGLVCYARELSVACDGRALSGPASLGLGKADQSLERNAQPIYVTRAAQHWAVSADAAHSEPYSVFRRETPAAASKYKKLVINFAHRWTKRNGDALRALSGMLELSPSCGSARFAAHLDWL